MLKSDISIFIEAREIAKCIGASQASDVQKRAIVRWANTARTKAASSSDPVKRAAYEMCSKRLQIMDPQVNNLPSPLESICSRLTSVALGRLHSRSQEKNIRPRGLGDALRLQEHAIKIHRAWLFRAGSQLRAWQEFNSQWQIMDQFSSSEPKVEIRCNFMLSLRLQILASSGRSKSLHGTNVGFTILFFETCSLFSVKIGFLLRDSTRLQTTKLAELEAHNFRSSSLTKRPGLVSIRLVFSLCRSKPSKFRPPTHKPNALGIEKFTGTNSAREVPSFLFWFSFAVTRLFTYVRFIAWSFQKPLAREIPLWLALGSRGHRKYLA